MFLVALALFSLPLAGAAAAAGLSPDLRGLEQIPLHVAAAPVIDKSLLYAVPRKDQPLVFALAVPLALTQADGLWDEVQPGLSRWRARVSSAGAKTLHFHFSGGVLPTGAALWIYDPVADTVQGPYTAAHFTGGELWTAVVRGDSAVIEARMPIAQRGAFALSVAGVQYGFLDWPKAGSLGNAGSCEIDVACSEGNAWRREIRSVGLITHPAGGSTSVLCSATLVNDVAQDQTPFLFTANHCGITGSNASQVTVYWQDQASSCSAGNGNLANNQTGSTLKLVDTHSDFTLLQLNAAPPAAAKVYFAGWDAGGTAASSGVGIHHPMGDVKKISAYTQPVTPADVPFMGATVKTWQVQWARGVTEEGSSGSGLWDQNHRLVGVLHGGSSDCSHPNDTDFYGRIDIAWSNGLRAQLDPGNSGATAMGGLDSLAATAAADAVSAVANSTAALIDVLLNDAGNQLSLTAVTAPNHGGTATISGNEISYRPAAGFSGAESFGYTITDINGATSSSTVTVTVTPPASAIADAYAVTQNSAARLLNVLANDLGSGLSLTSVSAPDHGGHAVVSGNQVSYAPAAGFIGAETFVYQVADSAGNNSSATVTITVSAAPPPANGGGGGGAMPPGLLALLLLLRVRRAAARRRTI